MRYPSTVLVTGASGFIGRALVDVLLEQRARIRILTRGSVDLPDQWVKLTEIRVGDLADPTSVAHVADGMEVVYHLAGEIRDPRLYDKVNREGTERLLEDCQSAGVRRFLYLSSVGVIGARGGDGLLDETAPVQPRNEYEISKYAGERATLLHHNANDMQTMVVRPTIVYGEDRNPRYDSFLSWVRAIKARRFVQLGRDYVSSYIYVGDVVAACMAVANDARTGGKVYIVNEPIPLSTLVAELSAILGEREPGVLPRPLGTSVESVLRQMGRFASLYNRTIFSMNMLAKLGFALPFGYRNGLRRTIQWYREKGRI